MFKTFGNGREIVSATYPDAIDASDSICTLYQIILKFYRFQNCGIVLTLSPLFRGLRTLAKCYTLHPRIFTHAFSLLKCSQLISSAGSIVYPVMEKKSFVFDTQPGLFITKREKFQYA